MWTAKTRAAYVLFYAGFLCLLSLLLSTGVQDTYRLLVGGVAGAIAIAGLVILGLEVRKRGFRLLFMTPWMSLRGGIGCFLTAGSTSYLATAGLGASRGVIGWQYWDASSWVIFWVCVVAFLVGLVLWLSDRQVTGTPYKQRF